MDEIVELKKYSNHSLCSKCHCFIPPGYKHDCRVKFYREGIFKEEDTFFGEDLTADDVLDIINEIKNLKRRSISGKIRLLQESSQEI